MGFFGTLARQILVQVVKPELERIATDIKDALTKAGKAEASAQAATAMVRELRKQMSAALAIDVTLKETGKVIVMTRIGGQDRVKIIDTKPAMTVREYRQLVESLEAEYGAKTVWVDGPPGSDVVIKG
jgi:hypothetical protein